MAATREQIMTQLVTQLAGITANGTPLKTAPVRRIRDPENVSSNERPMLALVEHLDNWDRPAPNIQAKRIMTVWALLYTDIGQSVNAIPMTQINQFMESIEAALAPDDRATNTFTLGGLVFSCMLKGEGFRAAGDTTGKSLTAMPIEIILP